MEENRKIMRKKFTQQYTIMGFLFGLLFPIFGTIIETSIGHGLQLTTKNLMAVHASNPLLWVVDTAPFFLGTFAGIAGNRQDSLSVINETLTNQLDIQSQLSQKLEMAASELETRVEQRTNELERRNKYLEAAGMVAHDATSILNPEDLLERTVSHISEQFGFYQVGIFLVDSEKEWAVLRAASSQGGKQMIARNHRLRVGKQGIVGFVTGIGQARISQDIGLDRIHSVTSELPDTRSEMALPLMARGQIIGALDIQDAQENAFSEEDVSVLQTLADQIALAIDNAMLYVQAQQSTEDIQRVYGDYSQQAWRDIQHHGKLPSYKVTGVGAVDASKIDPRIYQSKEEQGKVEIPINVRGVTVGSIDIIKDETNEDWSEDEVHILNALSDQLGVALDSARLFSETQSRAATETIISEVSTEIRETLDIDTILKTAAEKVRQAMNLPEVTIRLADPSIAATTNSSLDESS